MLVNAVYDSLKHGRRRAPPRIAGGWDGSRCTTVAAPWDHVSGVSIAGIGTTDERRREPSAKITSVTPIVRACVLAIAALASNGATASAHHSFAAEFDFQKPVTLKGTVVQWEMINPHGWITMDVAGEGGKTTQWMVETSNPNGLMRLGWTKRSLKPGDEITVDGYRAKDGSKTANAARVTLADGRKVFAGSSGTPAAPSGVQDK